MSEIRPSQPPIVRGFQTVTPSRAPAAPPPTARPAEGRQAPPAAPAEPVRERPAARREEPAEPREASAPAGRGGWLSDLLNRASQDGELPQPPEAEARAGVRAERSRASALESLDSISGDIARMINHDAAVDLWERYRRGETDLFSSRLYTTQGQNTFEELRRRYRRDPDFRLTVNRYVEEFERLLTEVSRDDRDGLLWKSYLTSETGKVYTMLAHASGRFE